MHNLTWLHVLSLVLAVIAVLLAVVAFIMVSSSSSRGGGGNNDGKLFGHFGQFDLLVHQSSDKETVLRALRNARDFLDHSRPSFVSLDRLSTKQTFDSGVDHGNLSDLISFPDNKYDLSNSRQQYAQGYAELKTKASYLAVSLATAVPDGSPTLLEVKENGGQAIVRPYVRLSDKKSFYYVQITQNYPENAAAYKSAVAYTTLASLVAYIANKFKGNYIIVGNFNVQGHEKVFEYLLGTVNHHIVPFYKLATCNDAQALASPDGLVVSKSLYNRLEYFVDFWPGVSWQHYGIGVRAYPRALQSGMFDQTSGKFHAYLSKVVQNRGNRTSYMGDSGSYDPKVHVANESTVTATNDLPTVNDVVLANSSVVDKLNNAK